MIFNSDSIYLTSPTAEKLYAEVKDLPIFDYHCHLSPEEICRNRRFSDIGELWLEADHYKWRLMRAAGVDEKFITGNASYKEKFFKFAEVVPLFVGNPVYHWAHLELKKYFGIDLPLSKDTAEEIWERTSRLMAGDGFSARELIRNSKVDTVITTDDPMSDLAFHEELKEEKNFKVLPCFRADRAINIGAPTFQNFIAELEKSSGKKLGTLDKYFAAVVERLDYFTARGCTAADVSFDDFPAVCSDQAAQKAYTHAYNGAPVGNDGILQFRYFMLRELAKQYAARNMVMQLHASVMRNVNSPRFEALGADVGIDSVSDAVSIKNAAELFDAVEREGGMPKTIVYTLNSASYNALATLVGDFFSRPAGKLQLGAAWWFNDHRDGIRQQLKTFAGTSALGVFNGMLTDSRSFVSYARHDYFRRILCSVLGEWVEAGEYPDDKNLVEVAKNICYFNAKKFFSAE